MKLILPLLLLAFTTVPGVSRAGEPDKVVTHAPLPAGECIDTTQINEWHIVDARTAIVRTGPKRYLVTLRNDCPRLGTPPPGLVFRANRSNQVNNRGRICGENGETVRSRYQPPCAIDSVSRIDKAHFDQLSAKTRRHGNGAEQPTVMPRP